LPVTIILGSCGNIFLQSPDCFPTRREQIWARGKRRGSAPKPQRAKGVLSLSWPGKYLPAGGCDVCPVPTRNPPQHASETPVTHVRFEHVSSVHYTKEGCSGGAGGEG